MPMHLLFFLPRATCSIGVGRLASSWTANIHITSLYATWRNTRRCAVKLPWSHTDTSLYEPHSVNGGAR